MFRTRHHVRRGATRVFLTWQFGVPGDIAHSCALQLADHRDELPGVSAHRHDAESAGYHGPADDPQAHCRDSCDKSSSATPSLKLTVDLGGDLPPMAGPPVASAWRSACPDRPPKAGSSARPRSARPLGPCRIAFCPRRRPIPGPATRRSHPSSIPGAQRRVPWCRSAPHSTDQLHFTFARSKR